MAYHPPPTIQRVPSRVRLLALLVLLAAAVVLVGQGGPRDRGNLQNWRQSAGEAVAVGDLFYRLGDFVQEQSRQHPDVGWYPGYLLNQRGLALYELQALGGEADPAALLRLGILYSRQGYVEQGREMLRRAGGVDPHHYALYWGLVQVYDPASPSPEGLATILHQLDEQPPWLQELVQVQLQTRWGSATTAAAAEELRLAHLNRFGLILVCVQAVVMLLVAVGLIMLLTWLLHRITRVPGHPLRPPLHVPWNIYDAAEVFALLVFLLILASVGVSALQQHLPADALGGALQPLLLLGSYCVYMGLALLLIYQRVTGRYRPWRLLGLRPLAARLVVWPALRAYATLLALLVPAGLYVLNHYLINNGAFFRGSEPPVAFALYFLLLCVIAPVAEELIFRGFFYPGLRRHFPVGAAALLSGLAFSAAHLPGAASGMVVIAALGVMLSLLYERTRSLWPCILIHALHNLLVFAVMVAVSAL
ncbi:MAG TPA: type II CAAX endopeptidase family protein [Armatimonadota bacterium]|jgi:hypothetical protein